MRGPPCTCGATTRPTSGNVCSTDAVMPMYQQSVQCTALSIQSWDCFMTSYYVRTLLSQFHAGCMQGRQLTTTWAHMGRANTACAPRGCQWLVHAPPPPYLHFFFKARGVPFSSANCANSPHPFLSFGSRRRCVCRRGTQWDIQCHRICPKGFSSVFENQCLQPRGAFNCCRQVDLLFWEDSGPRWGRFVP